MLGLRVEMRRILRELVAKVNADDERQEIIIPLAGPTELFEAIEVATDELLDVFDAYTKQEDKAYRRCLATLLAEYGFIEEAQ